MLRREVERGQPRPLKQALPRSLPGNPDCLVPHSCGWLAARLGRLRDLQAVMVVPVGSNGFEKRQIIFTSCPAPETCQVSTKATLKSSLPPPEDL